MKEKSNQSGQEQLKKDLEQENFQRLYLFYGKEVFLRDYYFKELKTKILPAGTENFNLHEINGEDMSLDVLAEALDALPMMAERTLVVVTDLDLFKNEDRRAGLLEILSDLPDYCTLVFFYDILEFKGDTRTKLGQCIAENGVLVDFTPLGQSELTQWIQSGFRNMGVDCPTGVAMELIFYCGDLMIKLSSEMEKIAAYSNGKEITKDDIFAVATPQLDAVVFQMTDFMGERNFDKALGVLWELNQMQEHPLAITKMVTRSVRHIYGAKLALEEGKNADYVAKLWGLKPYPAKKIMESARRFSLDWCRNALLLCAKADLGMKSGGGNEQDLLTGLVLELAIGRNSE